MVKLSGLTAVAALACPPICDGASSYPQLFIAGDSTAANYDSKVLQGWGKQVGKYLNLHITNLAKNGRSTRSFINDGYWAKLLELVTPGDFVVLEFGHNDAGDPTNSSNPRAFRNTLPGIGDETVFTTFTVNASALGASQGKTPPPPPLSLLPAAKGADGQAPPGGLAGLAALARNVTVTKNETVHTYGWYLKTMIVDVRDRGGVPVLSGMVPQYKFSSNASDATMNTTYPYAQYTQQVADLMKVDYIDHTLDSMVELWRLGPLESKKLFPQDSTHTNGKGAKLFAESFVRAAQCGSSALAKYINDKPFEILDRGCVDRSDLDAIKKG